MLKIVGDSYDTLKKLAHKTELEHKLNKLRDEYHILTSSSQLSPEESRKLELIAKQIEFVYNKIEELDVQAKHQADNVMSQFSDIKENIKDNFKDNFKDNIQNKKEDE